MKVKKQKLRIPKAIDTQSALAGFLHNHFKKEITITITSSMLGNWRKGIGVGKVLIDGQMIVPPPFPNKDESARRWRTDACIQWVRDWIVPQHRVKEGASAAIDYETDEQEFNAWERRRKRDIAEGKFKSVAIFNSHLILMGAEISRALNEGEKMLKKGDTPEAAMDAVREAVVKALTEAKESDTVQADEIP